MSSKKPDQMSEISKKLDVLIRLSALGLVRDIKTQKEQIALLSDAGFQPKQIADILGTTSGTVRVALHDIRKERGEKESKEEIDSEQKAELVQTKSESEVTQNSKQI